MATKDYTREDLIALIERAIVPETVWGNRDSATMHEELGSCWAFLKAGCAFEITAPNNGHGYITLDINYGEGPRNFSIPTPEKVDAAKANNKDWY